MTSHTDRDRRRAGPVGRCLAAVAVIVVCACISAGGGGLPRATSDQFKDLDQIAENAKGIAVTSGDPHPRGVAIVKSSMAAVFDHSASGLPGRSREMYFIRMDGNFQSCARCSGPSGAPMGPTRWISFDWDPEQHMSLDFGYGDAPHLEQFGTVYAVDLPK